MPSGEEENLLHLSAHTEISLVTVYRCINDKLEKLERNVDYTIYYTMEEDVKNFYIQLVEPDSNQYMVSYLYNIDDVQKTTIKQLHNNIFCAMDIYFDAVDTKTDDKHTVCLHCDKVQIFTDLAIGINNSQKASFTPIEIHSIATGDDLNKDIATITVI